MDNNVNFTSESSNTGDNPVVTRNFGGNERNFGGTGYNDPNYWRQGVNHYDNYHRNYRSNNNWYNNGNYNGRRTWNNTWRNSWSNNTYKNNNYRTKFYQHNYRNWDSQQPEGAHVFDQNIEGVPNTDQEYNERESVDPSTTIEEPGTSQRNESNESIATKANKTVTESETVTRAEIAQKKINTLIKNKKISTKKSTSTKKALLKKDTTTTNTTQEVNGTARKTSESADSNQKLGQILGNANYDELLKQAARESHRQKLRNQLHAIDVVAEKALEKAPEPDLEINTGQNLNAFLNSLGISTAQHKGTDCLETVVKKEKLDLEFEALNEKAEAAAQINIEEPDVTIIEEPVIPPIIIPDNDDTTLEEEEVNLPQTVIKTEGFDPEVEFLSKKAEVASQVKFKEPEVAIIEEPEIAPIIVPDKDDATVKEQEVNLPQTVIKTEGLNDLNQTVIKTEELDDLEFLFLKEKPTAACQFKIKELDADLKEKLAPMINSNTEETTLNAVETQTVKILEGEPKTCIENPPKATENLENMSRSPRNMTGKIKSPDSTSRHVQRKKRSRSSSSSDSCSDKSDTSTDSESIVDKNRNRKPIQYKERENFKARTDKRKDRNSNECLWSRSKEKNNINESPNRGFSRDSSQEENQDHSTLTVEPCLKLVPAVKRNAEYSSSRRKKLEPSTKRRKNLEYNVIDLVSSESCTDSATETEVALSSSKLPVHKIYMNFVTDILIYSFEQHILRFLSECDKLRYMQTSISTKLHSMFYICIDLCHQKPPKEKITFLVKNLQSENNLESLKFLKREIQKIYVRRTLEAGKAVNSKNFKSTVVDNDASGFEVALNGVVDCISSGLDAIKGNTEMPLSQDKVTQINELKLEVDMVIAKIAQTRALKTAVDNSAQNLANCSANIDSYLVEQVERKIKLMAQIDKIEQRAMKKSAQTELELVSQRQKLSHSKDCDSVQNKSAIERSNGKVKERRKSIENDELAKQRRRPSYPKLQTGRKQKNFMPGALLKDRQTAYSDGASPSSPLQVGDSHSPHYGKFETQRKNFVRTERGRSIVSVASVPATSPSRIQQIIDSQCPYRRFDSQQRNFVSTERRQSVQSDAGTNVLEHFSTTHSAETISARIKTGTLTIEADTVISHMVTYQEYLFAASKSGVLYKINLITFEIEKKQAIHDKFISHIVLSENVKVLYTVSIDCRVVRTALESLAFQTISIFDEPLSCCDLKWNIIFIGTTAGSLFKLELEMVAEN